MTLHYQCRGEPTKPAVILLHGLFGDLANLGQQARALAEDRYVISVDLPNHGRSPWQPEMTYPQMAAAVLAVADALQLDQFALLGHSMGGKVAMQLALLHPKRVSALIVADIAPVAYQPSHQTVFAGLQAVADAGITDRQQADSLMSESVTIPAVRQFLLKALTPNGWRFNLPVLKSAYRHILQPPLSDSMQLYQGPVLFIKGSESAYIQAEHQQAILARFPASQARVMQGAGHWLHAEKPAMFNRLVTRFLDGISNS